MDSDQRDFEAALPVLSAERRSWLKDALDGRSAIQQTVERRPRPARQHRWTAELTTGP
jgi:hypothetical protein